MQGEHGERIARLEEGQKFLTAGQQTVLTTLDKVDERLQTLQESIEKGGFGALVATYLPVVLTGVLTAVIVHWLGVKP